MTLEGGEVVVRVHGRVTVGDQVRFVGDGLARTVREVRWAGVAKDGREATMVTRVSKPSRAEVAREEAAQARINEW